MKCNRLFVLILFSIVITGNISGQASINFTDENGLKQGKWIKKFENGNIFYKATFRNDKPVGEFIRYYISGKPISVLYYYENSDSVDAVFYHPNEYLAAKGTYIGKKKEGEWIFYSSVEKDCVICRENYINNLKEGKSIKYHLNGNIAEELIYLNDIKQGEWIQYYTDGVICIKSSYTNNRVDGRFETFHTNGKKEIIGTYINDVRNGEWIFFNKDGSHKRTINYHNGVAENDKELIEEETKYLDMLEKNGGKIEDPEKKGVVW